jgi:hypothetical protein
MESRSLFPRIVFSKITMPFSIGPKAIFLLEITPVARS